MATETTLALVNEISDSNFSLIIDESRNKLINEQMAVILSVVNKQRQFVERFLVIYYASHTFSFSL